MAEWRGAYYRRKKEGNWRNANTGHVTKTPGSGKIIGIERRGMHFSGSDPRKLKKSDRKTLPKLKFNKTKRRK